MKKIVIIIFLLNAICISGQDRVPNLSDFNKACSFKVAYDEDFTPILTVEFRNVSQKTITTIEINANYHGYNPGTWWAPICIRTLTVNISPNEMRTLTYRLDRDEYNNRPKSAWISRIRFSDGSIINE